MVPKVVGSNPIFHPKFESLAQARLFCCIWAWELVHRGPYTTKSGVKDTFKLRKCPCGERKGQALSGAGKACVVANPISSHPIPSPLSLRALRALREYRIGQTGTPIMSYRGRKPESYLILLLTTIYSQKKRPANSAGLMKLIVL